MLKQYREKVFFDVKFCQFCAIFYRILFVFLGVNFTDQAVFDIFY